MRKYQFLLFIVFILSAGCTSSSSEPSEKTNPIHISNVSTKHSYDQSYANQAKSTLAQKKNVTKVFAVNSDKLLMIAIDVPHHERLQLKKYEKKLTKEMKKKFKKTSLKVEVSSDQKILWKLEQLEEEIRNGSISKKELKKKLEDISKLMKEKT
ncbi:YhcN/YlaJ family sporulation lipoprotein [Ornithinibacillus bavariensis]|uniref:YhcN/YlaJ family sporulation lipoprotein n=1 Tax=Ornithinibacillus bavariensis TaxID=545502 RepID=UPI000EC67017|nr:hypothetical protein [Ornithinibacillus sp.]